jgi:hypothetical protein
MSYHRDDIDEYNASHNFPPMPDIIRTTPRKLADSVFDDVIAEFQANEAKTARRNATKARNEAVLASDPTSPEATAIMAKRAYAKATKERAKARGYKQPSRWFR